MNTVMYVALKKGTSEIYSFTWNPDDELVILGKIVNKDDFEIIEIEIKEL